MTHIKSPFFIEATEENIDGKLIAAGIFGGKKLRGGFRRRAYMGDVPVRIGRQVRLDGARHGQAHKAGIIE